jgi:anti-sigma regulatory factor (Ser/Thr protein kinase)
VLGIMAQVQALAPHRSALFVIVSELFNNALDHGLLGLDSATKNQTGGIETYLEERARRLDTLATGRITMRFRLRRLDDRPALEIELADSGPGFDYAPYLATGSADPTNLRHGRGIRLVRAMCSELRYGGCGNQVYARYPL